MKNADANDFGDIIAGMKNPSFRLNVNLPILRAVLALVAVLCFLPHAFAQMSIEITGAGANRIPIAIGNFEGESALPAAVTNVVRSACKPPAPPDASTQTIVSKVINGSMPTNYVHFS